MDTSLTYRFPALKIGVLVIVGIVIADGLSLDAEPVFLSLIGLVAVSIGLLIVQRRGHSVALPLTAGLAVLCLLLGALKLVVDREAHPVLAEEAFLSPHTVIGTVTGEPRVETQRGGTANRLRFVLDGGRILGSDASGDLQTGLVVTLRRTRADTATPELKYGTVVALRGTLSRPPAERNPGEFSARQFYDANGISLFMRVDGFSNVVVLDSSGGNRFMRDGVLPVRRYIVGQIDRTIGGEEGEFLKGLLLGEKAGLTSRTREAFINAGVAHVLAVSGSNVAVVGGVLLGVFGFLRMPKLMRIFLTTTGLVFYMLLTGGQPPVVRATIMALVFLYAGLFQRKSNAYNTLGIAVLIILGIDARQVFDVGFQLSFVAVLAMIHLYPRMDAWITRIPEAVVGRLGVVWALRVCAVSLAATLGTLPLTAIHFGRVSVIGIAANMVVIPAVGCSVVLGILSAVVGTFSLWLAETYATVNHIVLFLTLELTRFSGELPVAYVDTLRFRPIDSVPFYAGLVVAANITSARVARMGFLIFLTALNVAVWTPEGYAAPSKLMRVSFIDVGQGDAVVVEFPDGKTMLVDAGPRSPTFDAGERVVVPFLKRRGIATIDLLVATHAHNDHIGGMPAVLRAFNVRTMLEPGQPTGAQIYSELRREIAREEGCVSVSARAGSVIEMFDNARVYTLYPTPTFVDTTITGRHPNLNNTSVVLKVCVGNVSLLLTGDAEEEAEEEMAFVYGDFLSSTMLKVGHHGSATSTTPEFLHAVEPARAVISVGRNNKFRHPSPNVVERLREHGTDISRTDEEGAVIFETDGLTLSRIEWR